MKKILCITLLLLMAAAVLVACDGGEKEHVHSFSDAWQYSDSEHWHDAACEHTSETKDKGAHVDADNNDICDVCGYVKDHTHAYEDKWSWDDNDHFHKASCGHDLKLDSAAHADENKDGKCDVCGYEKHFFHSFEDTWSWDEDQHFYKTACGHDEKKDAGDHADGNNDSICDVCSYNYGHTHSFDEGWTVTEGGHWHAPLCGHSIQGTDKEAHNDGNNDGACDKCGDMNGHTHTYAGTWSNDEDSHWKEPTCSHIIPPAENGAHSDKNSDGSCDSCGYKPPHFHTFEEGWTSDANGHWHKATCEHTELKNGEAVHDSYEEDGLCDTCGYAVFKFYTLTVNIHDYIPLIDRFDKPMASNSVVLKEGTEFIFKFSISADVRFEAVRGAELVGEPVKIGEKDIYTVKAVANGDITVDIIANKLVSIEDVIKDGVGSFECNKAGFFYHEVKFNAERPGKYAIYSLSNEDVQFASSKDSDTYAKYCVVDVEAAGEITFYSKYFAWGAETKEFTYYVGYIYDNIVLSEMEGSGYMLPAIVPVQVKIELPKAGLYQITSSYMLAWNDDISHPYIIYAPSDNYEAILNVRYDLTGEDYPITEHTYEFDWSVKYLDGEATALKNGENTIKVFADKYYKYTFTADKSGTYLFAAENEYTVFKEAWDQEYGYLPAQMNTFTVVLEAGETVVYYTSISASSDTPEDYDDTLNVSYLGFEPLYDQTANGYFAPVGITNLYYATTETDYTILLPNGGEISLDGGVTWHKDVAVIKVEDSEQPVKYLVKSNDGSDNVLVRLSWVSYEFTVKAEAEAQENTFAMLPGKEYTVYLTSKGISRFKNYILTWNAPDVTVSYGGQQFTSGIAEINTMPSGNDQNYVTIIYNGKDPVNVSFTLENVTE